MANKTKSGAWAVGDPMSMARIENEAKYAIENNINALWQTDEGRYLKRVFTSRSGLNDDDSNYRDYLHEFLRGFLFATTLPGILKRGV